MAARTTHSHAIEVSVLYRWLLETVGLARYYALAIGPLIQICLPWFHTSLIAHPYQSESGARSSAGD